MEDIVIEHDQSQFTFSKTIKGKTSNSESQLVQVELTLYPGKESITLLPKQQGSNYFRIIDDDDFERVKATIQLLSEAITFAEKEFGRSENSYKKKEKKK